jgi:hypothetical protein
VNSKPNYAGDFADWSLSVSDRVELAYGRFWTFRQNLRISIALSVMQIGILYWLILAEGSFQKVISFYALFIIEFLGTILILNHTRKTYGKYREAKRIKDYTQTGKFLEETK